MADEGTPRPTAEQAGEAMHTLLTRIQFCRSIKGVGWCCPVCLDEERQHAPGCELVAVLEGWKRREEP